MKDHIIHIEDMIAFIEEARTIATQFDREDLRSFRAIERDLAIIGEAANRLPESFRQQHPDVPWRKIIDLRNLLVHGYDTITPSTLWDIIDNHMPPLHEQLLAILLELKHD